jgi:hypothetical protein
MGRRDNSQKRNPPPEENSLAVNLEYALRACGLAFLKGDSRR